MKNKKYHQLTQEQRYHISGLRKAGMNLRNITDEVEKNSKPRHEISTKVYGKTKCQTHLGHGDVLIDYLRHNE